MKILYLSCHEVLEFDELSMFSELGIEFLSVGAYLNPDRPAGSCLRPPLPHVRVDQDDLTMFHSLNRSEQNGETCITAEFMNRFDAVIIMHRPDWVESCFNARPSVPIIWRTIGQSSQRIEQRMKPLRERGLRVVRYSPRERCLNDYCGEDVIIRFGKSTGHFDEWTGRIRRVVTITQRMHGRSLHCRYNVLRQVVAPFDCDLYGPGNEGIADLSRGPLSYDEQRRVLREYRVFLYTGTYPASYTLGFIEAWLAGIPVVAIGRQLWEIGDDFGTLYEIPELISDGVDGFVSDSILELQVAIRSLIDDDVLAREVAMRGRESAEQLFSTSVVKRQWLQFLETL